MTDGRMDSEIRLFLLFRLFNLYVGQSIAVNVCGLQNESCLLEYFNDKINKDKDLKKPWIPAK